MKFHLILPLAAAAMLTACNASAPAEHDEAVEVAQPSVEIPADLMERHDFSLATTPNTRTALAYLYTAWNDKELAHARATYWVPGSFPADGGSAPPVLPRYQMKRVIEQGDEVVVLALVEGFGMGEEFTTFFGAPGGIKVGDAVVEFFRFDPETGLIAEKVDIIQPMSEESLDF